MSQNNNNSDTEDGNKGNEETRASRYTKKNNNEKELRGAIEELGSNVHCYGNQRQGEFCTKTTESIADYVGREHNEDMRKLVKDGKEITLIEPTDPEGKETTYKVKKFEKDLARYYEKMDKYNEYKAKVFLVVKGQCSLSMKNKLEAMKEYGKLEKDDDVVGLLKIIKELSYVSTEVKYQYWSMTTMLYKLMNTRQGENETMAAYYKRFKNVVDIVEGQWGELYPEKVAKDDSDYSDDAKRQAVIDGCNGKLLACVFMHGANRKSHKSCIGELNNMYLSGSDRCPKSVEAAMTYMSHYVDQNRGDKSVEKFQLMQNRTVTCWLCNEEGHKAHKCPTRKKKEQTEVKPKLEAAQIKWHSTLRK